MAGGPAYRVCTDRLIIRCWEPHDAPALQTAIAANLEHLAQMPWIRGEPQSLDEKVSLLRRFRGQFDLDRDFVYGIFDRDDATVLGATGLHPRVGEGAREIGYWIHVAHIGRGLATEAAAAMTRVGFEVVRVGRMEIRCGPTNVASAAVARRLGYGHEATLRGRDVDAQGRARDTMIWSMFAEEYGASVAAGRAVQAYDATGERLI
jgi:RimJ/RimL family protein N-acetyltransferase